MILTDIIMKTGERDFELNGLIKNCKKQKTVTKHT